MSDRHWTDARQSPVTSALVAYLGSEYRMRPVSIPDISSHIYNTSPSLGNILDASGPQVERVRSPCDQRE
jgi:hypothetical protein